MLCYGIPLKLLYDQRQLNLPGLPLLTLLHKFKSNRSMPKIIFLLWSIWKEINAVIFSNEFWNFHIIFRRGKIKYIEWQARTNLDLHESQGSPVRGALPSSRPQIIPLFSSLGYPRRPSSFLKLNFRRLRQATFSGSKLHNQRPQGPSSTC